MSDALTAFSFASSYNDSGVSPTSYSDTVNYTITSDTLAASGGGGSYTFKTTSPIVQNTIDDYPSSGQIVIYGDNSTALRVTVVNTDINKGTASGTVTLEISTNTTTTTAGTWGNPATRTWTQIAAGQ